MLSLALASLSSAMAFTLSAPSLKLAQTSATASHTPLPTSALPLRICRMQEADAEPVVTSAPTAYIEFIVGVPEPCVPDVSLTRSRDGSTGVATFTFDNPSFLAKSTTELGDTTGKSACTLEHPSGAYDSCIDVRQLSHGICSDMAG